MKVGLLTRTEATTLVVGYEFNLQSNEIRARAIPNPRAGEAHEFAAYRLYGDGEKPVSMVAKPPLPSGIGNGDE